MITVKLGPSFIVRFLALESTRKLGLITNVNNRKRMVKVVDIAHASTEEVRLLNMPHQ